MKRRLRKWLGVEEIERQLRSEIAELKARTEAWAVHATELQAKIDRVQHHQNRYTWRA